MPLVQGYDTPAYADICDNFNISAVTAVPLSANSRLVATSGQIGCDEDTPYPVGDHVAQFDIALRNVERSLAAAMPHLSKEELWDGVFNVTSFHVGKLSREEQLGVGGMAKKWWGRRSKAWAAICVAGLFPEDCLVEVQVSAAYEIKETKANGSA